MMTASARKKAARFKNVVLKTAAKDAASVRATARNAALKEIEKIKAAALRAADELSRESEAAAKQVAMARARTFESTLLKSSHQADEIAELKRAVGEISAIKSAALQALPWNLRKRVNGQLSRSQFGIRADQLSVPGDEHLDGIDD